MFYLFNAGQGMKPEGDTNGYATSQDAMAALNAHDGRRRGWVCRECTPEQFAQWNNYNRWAIRDGKAVAA
jgi:hypothetical protein